MPRKDPMTGVQVMTDAEFWTMMANDEGQGRTGGDVMHDFYEDFDKAAREKELEEQRPDVMLKRLQACVLEYMQYEHQERIDNPEWYKNDPPYLDPFPLEILSYTKFKFDRGFRGFNLSYNFKAQCDDGEVHWGRYHLFDDQGSYWNPPDREEMIEWEKQ